MRRITRDERGFGHQNLAVPNESAVEEVEIEYGEEGDVATVKARGEDDRSVEAKVTRNPPSDDVWRVDEITGECKGGRVVA